MSRYYVHLSEFPDAPFAIIDGKTTRPYGYFSDEKEASDTCRRLNDGNEIVTRQCPTCNDVTLVDLYCPKYRGIMAHENPTPDLVASTVEVRMSYCLRCGESFYPWNAKEAK